MRFLDYKNIFSTTSTSTEPPLRSDEPEKWRMRESVGRYGIFIIVGGCFFSPLLLGLLIAIWNGKNGGEGGNASAIWRYVVLKGWVTAAVTLSSKGVELWSGFQSLVCTSLSAAIILETSGVPLSQIAEFSTLRGANDGPWRLLWLLFEASWKNMVTIQPILVILLYASGSAIHFGSTLLVTDLEVTQIVGYTNQTYTNATAPNRMLNFKLRPMSWYMGPVYDTFAEVPSGISVLPSSKGLSDTGNVKRYFWPAGRENRTQTRIYNGPAYGWNSRVACMPPELDAEFVAYEPGRSSVPYVLSLNGNIAYNKTFTKAGLPPISTCENEKCLPEEFNCTQIVSTNGSGDGIGFCVPNVENIADAQAHEFLSDGRERIVNANSMAVLMTKTNGTFSDWYMVTENPELPKTYTRQGEWAEWMLPTGIKFSASLCFVSNFWETSQVKVSTSRDAYIAKPELVGIETYDTDRLRKQLGVTREAYTHIERGIFKVDEISNTTSRTNNTFFLDISQYYLFGGDVKPGARGFTMHTSGGGSGAATVNPFVDFSGTLEDALIGTDRPASALQCMLSIKASTSFNNLANMMENRVPVEITETVLVQAPARWTGLSIYIGIITIHITIVITILICFLLKTKYSKQGHFWHAISQIITNDTVPLLGNSTESRDDHVINRHLADNPVVVVKRCRQSGRVQLARKDDSTEKNSMSYTKI